MIRTIKTFVVVAIAVTSLIGCASTASYKERTITDAVAPTTQNISWPAVNVETEVEIGQSMISRSRKTVTPAVNLENDLVHAGKYSDNYDYMLTIPSGKLIAAGSAANGIFFKSDAKVLFQYRSTKNETNQPPEQLVGGIYVPNNSADLQEVYWIWGDFPPSQASSEQHAGAVITKSVHEVSSPTSFVRELVYSGVIENSLSVLYREFLNDMARPAFSQDLKSDLAKDAVIGYKNARFKVYEATNTKIRYIVLNPLE